jgi:hypothetical protein
LRTTGSRASTGASEELPRVRLTHETGLDLSARAAEILDAARETASRVAGLRSNGEKKTYIAQAAQALAEFNAQKQRLEDLARAAGPRAKVTIADATQEIAQLHSELASRTRFGCRSRLCSFYAHRDRRVRRSAASP